MKILLAEDEKELRRALATVLKISKYDVDEVEDGLMAVEKAKSGVYDAMVFDIMMPNLDGIEALKQIRASGDNTPVLMLTAKSELDDRIAGLDAGADDYLTKPFAMEELLARIRSMLRRSGDFLPKKFHAGCVTLDIEQQELAAVNTIRLSGKENKLMAFFMQNSGKKVTTEEIYNHVWKNDDESDPSIVWVYVSYLRQKLKSIQADISIDGEKDGEYLLVVS